MSLYVAAYDIAEPRIRRRVAKVLEAYGERIQRSVFEIRLDRSELRELKLEVGSELESTDDFSLYPIDERIPARRIRWQKAPVSWDPVIEI